MTPESKMLTTIEGGSGVPQEPDWSVYYSDELDLGFVRAQWRSIISEMRDAQTLAPDNGDDVKRLVAFRLEADRALRDMGENGSIRAAKRTKVRQIDPAWTVFKQAGEGASALEAELALSPRRRNSGGKVQRKSRKITAADEFLRPVRSGNPVGSTGG